MKIVHNLTFAVQDHAVLDLISLEKQGRPGHVRGFVSVKQFHDDPRLCPLAALVEYSKRVRYNGI